MHIQVSSPQELAHIVLISLPLNLTTIFYFLAFQSPPQKWIVAASHNIEDQIVVGFGKHFEGIEKDVHAFMTCNLSHKENTSPAVVSSAGLLSNISDLFGHRSRNNMVLLLVQEGIRIEDRSISQIRIVYEVRSYSVYGLFAS